MQSIEGGVTVFWILKLCIPTNIRLILLWMSATFKVSHTDAEDRGITSIDKFISALKSLLLGWSMLAT